MEGNQSVLKASHRALSEFKNKHSGKRCVIIGNGPSLNRMDLSFLRNEITFGLNRIYLLFDQWDFKPTYYVAINPLVIEQSIEQIRRIPVPKFLSLKGLPFVSNPAEFIFVNSIPQLSFCRDPRGGVWEGYTVTYVAMQLAYFMGFSEVFLIGVDHSFVTPGPANKEITSDGPDPNHFSPDYFGKGIRWNLPDLNNSEAAYRLAKDAFEGDGRVIIDATLGGHLELFPKADYRQVFLGETTNTSLASNEKLQTVPSGRVYRVQVGKEPLSLPEYESRMEGALQSKSIPLIQVLMNEAIRYYGRDPRLWVALANVLRRLGKFHEAERAAQRALGLKECPEALFELAQIYRDVGDSERAHSVSLQIDQRFPGWTRLPTGADESLGFSPPEPCVSNNASNNAGKDIQAEEDACARVQKPLGSQPDNPEVLVSNGDALFGSGDFLAAREQFQRATQLVPVDPRSFVRLALCNVKLERWDEFEKALGRALELDPNHHDALRLLADLNYQQNRFVEAAQTYSRMLQQTPDDVEILLPLGNCFFKTGDLATAQTVFERLLQLQPNHALAKENLEVVRSRASVALQPGLDSTGNSYENSPENQVPSQAKDTPMSSPVARRPLVLDSYFQPAAGLVEKWLAVRPICDSGGAGSTFQALKEYSIRDFGAGLPAVEGILAHIAARKFQTSCQLAQDFWRRTVVLPVTCELRSAETNQLFHELPIRTLNDISPELTQAEPARVPDIERYARMLRAGRDLGSPLYITGRALNHAMKVSRAEEKGIYMIDGARRLTASALVQRRSVSILLIMTEDEHAELLPQADRNALRTRIGGLAWFNNYQAIPIVGLQGQRSLNRFNLIDMALLRDQTVMDFGCNIGQACIQAVQAGAKQVVGIEGMADTFQLAEQIRKLCGFANLHYLNVDFNQPDFEKVIDGLQPGPVDYSFFFSVYRTKELKQRDRLFQYIIGKTRKGIFFEGHAHPKIDTLEYYEWLFESFHLQSQFLGYSEGNLRPLFFLPLSGNIRANVPQALLPARVSNNYLPEKTIRADTKGWCGPSMAIAVNLVPTADKGWRVRQEFCIKSLTELRQLGIEALNLCYKDEIVSPPGWHVLPILERSADVELKTDGKRKPFVNDIFNAAAEWAERHGHEWFCYTNNDIILTERFLATVRHLIKDGYDSVVISRNEIDSFNDGAMTLGKLIVRGFDVFVANVNWWKKNHQRFRSYIVGERAWDDAFASIMLSHGRSYVLYVDGLAAHFPHATNWISGPYADHNMALYLGPDRAYEKKIKSLVVEIDNITTPALTMEKTQTLISEYFGQTDAIRSEPCSLQAGSYVNICMVTFNRLEYTRRAIEGLLKYTSYPHVITVVDNASTDGTRAFLLEQKAKGIIKNLILLDENVGVAKASNLAWHQEPSAEFYIKFDNDIVIQKPDWLEKMVQVLEAIPQVGVLGYSFEPVSYPVRDFNGVQVRIKPKGNIGGACILVPRRTQQRLGFWCEDYGLYSEEDADYGARVSLAGLLNAYMADEEIGIHLPSGRAAPIDGATFTASDRGETESHPEYRVWKDQQRRNAIGRFRKNVEDYATRSRSLFVESQFAKTFKTDGTNTTMSSNATGPGSISSQTPEFAKSSPSKMTLSNPEPKRTESASVTEPRPPRLRIGLLSVEPDQFACPYLRVISPLDCLAQAGSVELIPLRETKDKRIRIIEQNLANVDLVIVQRQMAQVLPVERLRRIADQGGFKIVYELDDAVTEVPPGHPGFHYYSGMRAQIEAYLREADLVTVSTERMKQGYQPFNKRIVVLPNAIDLSLWTRRAVGSTDGRVRVLFSGTSTHDRDLEVVERSVRNVLNELGDKVILYCWGEIPKGLAGLPNVQAVHSFRKDYREYARLLQEMQVDLGIVPLEDTPFNQAKSQIKWLEYSICGIPGIYSNVGEYPKSVRQGETGLVVENTYEAWHAALIRMIEDSPSRRLIAERAHSEVRRHHSIASNAYQWLEAYRGLLQLAEEDQAARQDAASGLGLPSMEPKSNEAEAKQLLARADAHYQNREFQAAHDALRKALELFPTDGQILESLGAVCFAMDQFPEACEYFVRATELCPQDASVFARLALTYLNLDRIDDFERALGRALTLDPGHRLALKLLADLNFQHGSLKDAAQSYVDLLRQSPEDLELLLPLGVSFFKMGDLNTAKAVFERALAIQPENAIARENLGVIDQQLSIPQTAASAGVVVSLPAESPAIGNKTDVNDDSAAPSSTTPQNHERLPARVHNEPVPNSDKKSPVTALVEQAGFFIDAGNREAALESMRQAAELDPNDLKIVASLGSLQFTLGYFAAAREQFRRCIELQPRDPDSYTRLAMCCVQLNRVEEMEAALGIALEIDPDHRDALKFLAKVNVENQRVRDAGRIYAKLLEKSPNDLESLLALGLCFYRGGDRESARLVYSRVLELDPQNQTAHDNLVHLNRLEAVSMAATGSGSTKQQPLPSVKPNIRQLLAEADAALGSKNLAGARSALEKARTLAPSSCEILSALGSVCFQLGDLVQAKTWLTKLVEQAPDNPQTWVQLALAHYQLQEIDPFEVALNRALKLDPNHLEALRLLAHLNFTHGSVADAAQTYGKILHKTPDDVEVLMPLGVCFYKLGDYPSAEMVFERVIELAPENRLARENLNAIKAKSSQSQSIADHEASVESFLKDANEKAGAGDLQGAADALEQARRLSPDDPEILATLGSLRYQLGDWPSSESALSRAVALRPDSPDYQTRLAMALLKVEKIPEFEQALSRALALNPDYVVALKLLAGLNFEQGQMKQAAEIYFRILQKNPDDIEVLLVMGVCFGKSGDHASARMMFERALELDPENGIASDNLKMLDKLCSALASEPNSAPQPRVSIIIPVLNRIDLTRQCLASLFQNTPQQLNYEVIVIDNGSADGTEAFISEEQKQAALLRYERNTANQGFARACNQGARAAKGEILLFLNNDTQPQVGWLEALLAPLARDSRIGAVGAKLLYPDGRIQHAGIDIVKTAADPLLARNSFVGEPGDSPKGNETRVCQAITAACMLVRKASFDQVGGFDEGYWNGYEDVDFCFKLGTLGWQCVYQPQSVVIHHESQSGPERFQKARQNIARLHEKWLGKVTPDIVVGCDEAKTETKLVSKVSIIILTHNQLSHTQKCLESIEQYTPEAHELILVDNGSTDDTPEFLKQFQQRRSNVRVIFNATNRGFAAGNNQGLSLATGDFVLLLNNDTIVTPDWLWRLLDLFRRSPEVGIIGPMSNYVSGPQLVSVVGYQNLDELPGFAREWSAQQNGQSFPAVRIVGFCLMVRRAVLDKVGGLDEQFGSGNFEDDDLCLRARLAGYSAAVAKDVFIHHTGNQTFRGAKIDYRQSMLRNWELFKRKWGLPLDTTLEQGYRIPVVAFDPVKHFIPLPGDPNNPPLQPCIPAPAADSTKFEVPTAGRLGSLKKVHDLMARKKYLKAWNAVLDAMRLRPFHPDGYLQLTDIALTAGDEQQAFLCAERLIELTPNWSMARKVYASLNDQKSRRTSKTKWTPLPPRLEKPRLTVCLIVKNEEDQLGNCLASVKPIASQIIVVDTGSSDRTIEIAKEHGAEVYHFPWNDNFSDARNAAHEHARGDWVLILDADEELPVESHLKIFQDMADRNVLGYRIPICNLHEDENAVTYVPRLFRNAPALFFVGRVHEQIYSTVVARRNEWGMDARLGTAKIVHHGYDPELVKRRQKIKRNLRLLERAVEEMPTEPGLLMNYGLDLVNDGQLEAGLEQYRKAVRYIEPHPPEHVLPEVRERLMTLFGAHLIRAERFEEVFSVMTSRVAMDCGPTASMSFMAALALMKLKRPVEAIPHLRACLSRRHVPALTPPCREVHKSGPHHLLAECLFKNNQMDESERQFKAALEADPAASGVMHDYAYFLHLQHRSVEALQILHGAMVQGINEPRIWHLGSHIANSKADFIEFALDWTGEAVQFCPDHSGIQRARGEVLLKAGRLEEAQPFFQQPAQAADAAAQAALILCKLVVTGNLTNPLTLPEINVSQEFIAWYRRLLMAKAKETVLTINSRVESLRRVLPTAAATLDQALAKSRG